MNTEVDIDIIQSQIQNCEDIVNNIDSIVPKLYKIRQQALSQKNYANDVIGLLLNNMSGVTNNKVIDINPTINFDNDVNTNNLTNSFDKSLNTKDSRKIIHSLFKFKHDLGTSKHFTTEQIGLEDNRTKGLNLVDIKLFTGELNTLLSNSNTVEAGVSGKDMYLPIRDNSSFNYETTSLADLTPALNTHLTALTLPSNYVGFGIN